MVSCARVISKIINKTPTQVETSKNVGLRCCNKAEKLTNELETLAMQGQSAVKSTSQKFVERCDLCSETTKQSFNISDRELKELEKIAETGNGLLREEPISILKELKLATKDNTGECTPFNLTKILHFLENNGSYDHNIKDKIIKYLSKSEDKYFTVQFIDDLTYYKNCSTDVKNKIIDLCTKMQSKFSEELEFSCGVLSENFNSETMELISAYIGKDLNCIEKLNRITKFSKIIDNIENIEPLKDLFKYQYMNPDLEPLINKLFNSNILPTKGTVEIFKSKNLEKIEEFFSIMKPLTELGFNTVSVDKYTIENILKDKSKFNNIVTFVKDIRNREEFNLKLNESTLDPSKYQIGIISSKGFRKNVYDKATNKLVFSEKVKFENNMANIDACDCINNRLIKQKLNQNLELLNETIIHNDNTGSVIFKDFTIQSNVPGQYDVYRQLANGKIKVIAKSFKDPISGEVEMIRNLTSPNGTKTKINYSESKDGSYKYDYIIKNKKGKIISENHNKYTVLDENHFISEVKGQKYDIVLKGKEIIVTRNNDKPVILNLEEIVPLGDSRIINTIRHLPGNELLNLKNLNVRIKKSVETDNAAYTGVDFEDFVKRNMVKNIEIGGEISDSLSILLHEMGHIKSKALSNDDWNKIIEVFKNELQMYKEKHSTTDERLIDYLIDTNHYLNSGKGAIEEAISDILAMRIIPHDKNLDRTAIRGLKFQENFPETIACVDKIFNS